MKQSFDPKQVESLLAQDSALQERLERSLVRLAARPGAEIDEATLQQAMAEAGIPASGQGELRAMDDDALENVAGGRILFNQDGVNRNSWFVSLLSMLLAQDEGRPASAGQSAPAREIRIDGKTFRVLRTGVPGSYRYVLEEIS